MSPKKSTPKKGASRMREMGRKQVVLWLLPEEIRKAKYAFRGVPLATALRRLLCDATGIEFRRK
jgi:hypothetical protein